MQTQTVQINTGQILQVTAGEFGEVSLYWSGGTQNVFAATINAGEQQTFGPYVDVARLQIVGNATHEIINRSNPVPTLLADVISGETPSAPVTSVNEKTGDVVLTASDVGALPDTFEAPVLSVNGETGVVTLNAANVGALPDTYTPPQGAAVPDATTGTEADTINALLASLRANGTIAT